MDYCRNTGGVLASVHSESQWNEIKAAGAAARCNGNCGGHPSSCEWFWLGGSLSGGSWQWVDGTPFDYHPNFFEVDNGPGVKISGWLTHGSCHGKGDGWHDGLPSWKQQALCAYSEKNSNNKKSLS